MANGQTDRYGNPIPADPGIKVVINNNGIPVRQRTSIYLGPNLTAVDNPGLDATTIDASGGGGGGPTTNPVTVAQGGTGSTTAATALIALGVRDLPYFPESYGALGDNVQDDSPAFAAMLADMPIGGGAVQLRNGAIYKLSSDLLINIPVQMSGTGNSLARNPRLNFAAGASLRTFRTFGTSSAGSDFKNFYITGTFPAEWQASHAYTVGQVIRAPKTFGGFTFFVYRCTVAGTSGASAPAFISRDDHGNNEGATFTDGSVTWTCVNSPGMLIKEQAYVSGIYVYNCPGDGFYWYGWTSDSPASNVSGSSQRDCWAQNNLGYGMYIEGSDANSMQFSNIIVQGNWAGGIFDNSGVDNLFLNPLSETNGLFAWGALGGVGLWNPIGFGAGMVPSPTYMNNRDANSLPVYWFTTAQTTGTTGAVEPVWPTTVGATIVDGSITWTCAGVYTYGYAYKSRPASANSNVWIDPYMEQDQRLAFLDSNNVVIGGSIVAAGAYSYLFLGNRGNTSGMAYLQWQLKVRGYLGPANPGTTGLSGDGVVYEWQKGDGSLAYDIELLSNKYWAFISQHSTGSLFLTTANSDEPDGNVVMQLGAYIGAKDGRSRSMHLSASSYSNNTNLPPTITGVDGDFVFNSVSVGPSGWVYWGSKWNDVYFDTLPNALKGNDLTNASVTITLSQGSQRILPIGTLSTNRTVTLGVSDTPKAGKAIVICRKDLTANTLAIVNGGGGAGTLYTFEANVAQTVTFVYDGADWQLAGAVNN